MAAHQEPLAVFRIIMKLGLCPCKTMKCNISGCKIHLFEHTESFHGMELLVLSIYI